MTPPYRAQSVWGRMLPLKEASHEEHVRVDQKQWKPIFSVMENARTEPYMKYMKKNDKEL